MGRPVVARPTDAPPLVGDARGHVPRPRPGIDPLVDPEDASARPLSPDELPHHVAIIMDGNRRWAREHRVDEFEGHAAGVTAIRLLLRHVADRGIPVLSLYAFSRENWSRPDPEVMGLFALLEQAVRDDTDRLRAEGVRVRLLGRLDELPEETRRSIEGALAATEGGGRLLLNVAFNYGGRTELVDAVRTLVARGVRPEEVDESAIAGALYTAGLPDPDLVIRTGGEQRLSNFLIWQSAYAEFYSCPTLWPDFGPEAFDAALVEFASRARRFGR